MKNIILIIFSFLSVYAGWVCGSEGLFNEYIEYIDLGVKRR